METECTPSVARANSITLFAIVTLSGSVHPRKWKQSTKVALQGFEPNWPMRPLSNPLTWTHVVHTHTSCPKVAKVPEGRMVECFALANFQFATQLVELGPGFNHSTCVDSLPISLAAPARDILKGKVLKVFIDLRFEKQTFFPFSSSSSFSFQVKTIRSAIEKCCEARHNKPNNASLGTLTWHTHPSSQPNDWN